MVDLCLCRPGRVLLWDHIPTLIPPYVRGSAAGLAHREVRGKDLRFQTSLIVQRERPLYVAWQTLISKEVISTYHTWWSLGAATAQHSGLTRVALTNVAVQCLSMQQCSVYQNTR